MGDPAAMETSALANLLAVRERMKEKKNGALKSAKLNTSIAAKIKTKIINNSSILKISLKHNNKALAMALTAEKEKCRRFEIERMYLQKEVKMVHFHNAVLRQNLNAVNKTLREIELFMNLNLSTAIEVSANTECSADFLPVSASQRNSECLSRSSEISLDDDCTVRCTAVPLRVPYKQADDKLCQDNNSESTKKIRLFPPGCTKLSNFSKGSVESSNAEAAFAVNKISRVSLKCIEQGSEDALIPNLNCLQSDCPSADIKGSCGGSGHVTQRRKGSTMSLSSKKSLTVGHDQDNASTSLSDSFSEANDNCESNEQADEQDTSCRESYTMKQGSDQKKKKVLEHLQFKDYDKLQPEWTESGAELDVTASDSGMIAIFPSKAKNTDGKGTREESDNCDRVSLRKVRYSCNEKKLKNAQKSGSNEIKKTSSKIKLKDVSEVAQKIEPQFEIITPANSQTLTDHQLESNINRWDRDHNDYRRTFVVQLSQVKLEQNDPFDEESKETEQNVVCKNVKVLENLCKKQNPLGMADPLDGCTDNILNFEESHRNKKSPLLQENICRTVGKKGKSKVSKKTCEKEAPLESCNIGVLRQKENEILNGPVLQEVSHLITKKNQSVDENSCDEVNLSESCAIKLPLHVIQRSNFEEEPTKMEKYAVCKNSQMLENLNKNQDCLPREYPLEVNIVNGLLFSETKDTSNMQTLKLQPFSISEKHKHKVYKKPCIKDTPSDDFTNSVTFEGSQELQHQPTLCEMPKKTIARKGKQKVSKKIYERETTLEICSATALRNGESKEISNVPIYQEKTSWLIPKKKHKVENECSESSELPLENCTIKTLPSAVANQAILLGDPSCITEKNQEVNKNSCDTTGAAKESHSVKMSFGGSQDVLDLPPFRDNTCILVEKPKERENHERDLLSGNSSAKMLPGEKSSVTDFQEQPSSFLETSKPKVSKNTCESRAAPAEIFSLKQPPFEECLEISNTTLSEKLSSVIEKEKKCVLKNTHRCLENFTNISSVECQVTALQEQPLDVPKRKGTQKVNKGTCGETLYVLPLEKKNISNIPVCIKKSKAVNEVEQKYYKNNYEPSVEGSDEDNVLNSKCLKKEKASRRESKTKKKQNRRIRAAPRDESEQHSQRDESETCDKYTNQDALNPSKRIYRVSFASSKLRRETYVVGVSEPELCTSAERLLEDKLMKPIHGMFGAAEFSASTEHFVHNENVKDKRGTYDVRAPQSEVGLNSDLKDENVQPRRGTYFVRPLNDKVSSLSTVLSEDLAADRYEDNVCVSDCTNPSVLLDQLTKSRRCTYVVREPDASDCNVLRNSTCMLSESLQSNAGQNIVAKLNNTSESSEWYDQKLTKQISSRKIRSMRKILPLIQNNMPLLEDCADAKKDVTVPVHTIAANSKSEEYQKIDLLDMFNVKTEQFMVDMISDSILVDSTADCPSVLEFSNITAQENIPFTPRKSSDDLSLLALTPTEEHNNFEPFDSLRTFEGINRKETHNENIVQKIESALSKAPSVRMETPRKTNKALQDLTNIGDNSSNPSPKTCIKLEQSSPPRKRRRAPVNYAEPKLGCKLRRGDQHTNTEFLSSPIFKGTKKISGKTRVKKATVKSV